MPLFFKFYFALFLDSSFFSYLSFLFDFEIILDL